MTRHIVVIVLVLQYRLKKILCFKKKKTSLLQQTATISSVLFINL